MFSRNSRAVSCPPSGMIPMLSFLAECHEPWYHGPADDEVRVVGVVLLGLVEDRPRTPRVFLIPETGDVQVRDRRTLDLRVPRLALVECVVVRVLDRLVPGRNRIVEVLRVDVREWTEPQIPLVGVVGAEVEMGIGRLARLLQDGVLEVVALAQRAVAVVVVVHPLVGRRRLFADRLERRMRHEQRHRRREAVVRDAVHPDVAVVVRNVLDEPIDRVVRVGGLVDVLRRLVGEIHGGREQERALRLESAAKVLNDEDVPVGHQLA